MLYTILVSQAVPDIDYDTNKMWLRHSSEPWTKVLELWQAASLRITLRPCQLNYHCVLDECDTTAYCKTLSQLCVSNYNRQREHTVHVIWKVSPWLIFLTVESHANVDIYRFSWYASCNVSWKITCLLVVIKSAWIVGYRISIGLNRFWFIYVDVIYRLWRHHFID